MKHKVIFSISNLILAGIVVWVLDGLVTSKANADLFAVGIALIAFILILIGIWMGKKIVYLFLSILNLILMFSIFASALFLYISNIYEDLRILALWVLSPPMLVYILLTTPRYWYYWQRERLDPQRVENQVNKLSRILVGSGIIIALFVFLGGHLRLMLEALLYYAKLLINLL